MFVDHGQILKLFKKKVPIIWHGPARFVFTSGHVYKLKSNQLEVHALGRINTKVKFDGIF